jgi:2-dehydropantoate 2-reductase
MNIAILGAGSLGSLIAGFLGQGSAVDLLVHSKGEHGAMMVAKGLQITGEANLSLAQSEALFTLDEVGLPSNLEGTMDAVLITGKANSTQELAMLAQRLLAPEGVASCLSNGLGHAEVLIKALGRHRVIAGTTTYAAYRSRPGTVYFAGQGTVTLGYLQGGPTAIETQPLIDAFIQSGLACEWTENGHAAVWNKVLLNIAINPIAALSGVQNGDLLKPQLFTSALEAMLEGARVARQERVLLPDDLALEQRLEQVLRATAENRCSMLQDVMAGRTTEITYLNKAVVEHGERIGIAAPINQMLTAMIEALTPQ